MIFVVLGTQKFQCNRLLRVVDELVENGTITEEVYAQRGHSDYTPQHYAYTDFMDKDSFEEKIGQCSLLITHSGVGTILSGIHHGKGVIVFPRLKKYGEHVDDHQLDIARAFGKKKLVLVCGEEDSLAEVIKQSADFDFQPYKSRRDKMLGIIRTFLREELHNV